jgi:hypothetical protein
MSPNDKKIIKAIMNNINSNSEIKKYYDFTYKSQKHDIENILTEILIIIKYAIPWRETRNIPYSTVYSAYKRLIFFGILKSTYIGSLKIYLKLGANKKLKYQYTDTTIVSNKYGSSLVMDIRRKKEQKFRLLLILVE